MDSASSSELSPTSSRSEVGSTPTSTSECDPKIQNVQQGSKRESIHRWRPSFHLQPAIPSWMNDPCAPFYDQKTGLYHVSWQWNPNGPDWGDICWGTATSPDLIHWTMKDKPSLSPDQEYDHKGVFTGCFMPSSSDALFFAYTSVSQFPIHHTLPHITGSESLSMACSRDGGESWQKIEANPILPSEPEDLDVTGWRDPFVAKWPAMARVLELDADTSFGIISGGIRDRTPTTFLYTIDSANIAKWKYVGPLADFGLNYSPSRWSGDLGKNWEVSNFLTLTDECDSSIEKSIIVCGTEGCRQDPPASDTSALSPSRPPRQELWFCGDFQAAKQNDTTSPVTTKYKFGGHLDHGILYAANSFFDSRSQKHIIWGWIGEEDLCDDLRHSQGWSGMLSMPRELRLMTMNHVVGAVDSDIQSLTSMEAERDPRGLYTLRTLASQPYQPLIEQLRQKPGVRRTTLSKVNLVSGIHDVALEAEAVQTRQWELDAVFSVSDRAHNIGICIAHSEDWSRTTTIFFDQSLETFVINRPALPALNSSELINNSPEIAPHTLFYTCTPTTGLKQKEKLRIRAWRDSSVLEVFVNERTAISTRLYAADETFGMRFFVDDKVLWTGDSGVSELVSATIWDGIGI